MSLLLDALKKAAEKKAQKNAENTAVDNTEVLTRTQVTDDETIADETVAMTRTELDATQIDGTQLDATELDSTQHDKTVTDTTLKIDPTQIDTAQVKRSNQKPASESTQEIDVSKLDLSGLSASQSDTTADETPLSIDDEVQSDTTRLDATQIDATELTGTQVDIDVLDRTATDTKVKTDRTQPETDQANKSVQESTQELDIRELDLSKLAAEENEIIFDTGADETISFIDEDDMFIDSQDEDETVVLTPDDITEFLGDGSRPDQVKQSTTPSAPAATRDTSDDTTITNSDSLSLTNIGQDEHDQKTSSNRTASPVAKPEQDVAPYQEPAFALTARPEDVGNATLTSMDSTPSSVDIEKLTNDETVTIKDSTFTRTFAPDNYDRTLMKLADKDVSRIFPGMRSETDSVMTPDYAKKVFISKSKGVKNYYYKVYAGIAISILLLVIIWGLFEVQTEFDSIDTNLVALKRDPMPGVIKPKKEPEPINLFPSTSMVNNKTIKVIEKANQAKEATVSEVQTANAEMLPEADASEQTSSQNDAIAPVQSNVPKSAPVKVITKATKQQTTTQAKTSSLQISSNNRVSKKDQLLAEAYAAYESGDIDKARKQYQQVINLDPENRDALLGRAAIHVYDNQFENAITLYQKILLSNPKDDLAMTSLISVANVDPQSGETEIKRLLHELPDSPYLHFALGNMFGNQNRWPEAQKQYFKALQYKPNDPNYAYNMAISLEHMDQVGSAISYYQRALNNKANGLATFSDSVVQQRIEVLSQ
jgi:tetratricopeptide (TPR) repeat protein